MRITNLKEKLLSCALILLVACIMYIFDIPCLFRLVFHIPCAGCGMTRAYISLLHLDIRQAFSYNAMFWTVPICFALYLFDSKPFKQKWLNICVSLLIYGALVVNWIIMLIAGR